MIEFGPEVAFSGPSDTQHTDGVITFGRPLGIGSNVMSITRFVGVVFLGFFAYLGVKMIPDLMRYLKISSM